MPERRMKTQRLRQLTLNPSDHPRGLPHLAAASGLVCAHGRAYVIADDENHLAVFCDNHSPGRLHRVRSVRSGELPADAVQRKRVKPDFESLMLLPARGHRPGALLALGSGSKPQRDGGALIALQPDGEPEDRVSPIDIKPLYAVLRQRLGAINIEGAFISGTHWVLLNRGVGGQPSASVCYALSTLHALVDGRSAGLEPVAVQTHDLGFIDGVQLAFTDGAALPGGGFLFSAVAEATPNSVDDGACTGSVIGHIDGNGALVALRRLASAVKVEGLALQVVGGKMRGGKVRSGKIRSGQIRGGQTHLALVTDADDPSRPAEMLLARW